MITEYTLQFVQCIINHEKNTVVIFIIISVFKVLLIGCDKQWCMYYVSVCTVFDVTNSGLCIMSLCVLYLMRQTMVYVLRLCVYCI